MKTLFIPNKTKLIISNFRNLCFILLALMIFSACVDSQQKAQKKELQEVKEKTKGSINSVINTIDERIQEIEEHKEKATAEVREEMDKSIDELKNQLSDLKTQIKKVEESTIEQWQNVLTKATQKVAESRKKTRDISLKIRELLEDSENE